MESISPSTKVLAEVDNAIGWITFNNPRRHNAMSLEMWLALGSILEGFGQDSSIRVVILKAAGEKAFVSGADISEFENMLELRIDGVMTAYHELEGRFHVHLKELDGRVQARCGEMEAT